MNAALRSSRLATFCVIALFVAGAFNPAHRIMGFPGFVLWMLICLGSCMVPRAAERAFDLVTLLAFNLLCLAFLYAARP